MKITLENLPLEISFHEWQQLATSYRICLVDLRETPEWEEDHIPGALHFPLSKWNPELLPQEGYDLILFYCRSGNRSLKALKAWQTDASLPSAHLKGGMLEFRTFVPHLHFFNTLSRKKEVFQPYNSPVVNLYTCGPTVYNFAHIGNFRTYLFEDLVKRVLKTLFFVPTHVMNITDVDDKTIKGAIEEKISLYEFTKPFTEAFFKDLTTLKIDLANYYPKATDYIEKMISMIESLLKKEHAYIGKDGSVYFSIRSFPTYGRLSHLEQQHLLEGASERVDGDEYEKENASDFVLWKAYDPERDGEIFWESPFGKGRPGWHIECSAMATELLGPTVDIHMGGVDNIFPHHENEIAQSECCYKKPFSLYWLHSEHLLVDGKKMSKSLGNFYTLRDLLEKGFSGEEVRFFLLSQHYRTPLNFTLDSLLAARKSIERISSFYERLHDAKTQSLNEYNHLSLRGESAFINCLADDFSTSEALAAFFEWMKEINILIDSDQLHPQEKQEALSFLLRFNQIFQLTLSFTGEIPEEVNALLEQRKQARSHKNWKESDSLRDLLYMKGWEVKDTPQGQKITPITEKV